MGNIRNPEYKVVKTRGQVTSADKITKGLVIMLVSWFMMIVRNNRKQKSKWKFIMVNNNDIWPLASTDLLLDVAICKISNK